MLYVAGKNKFSYQATEIWIWKSFCPWRLHALLTCVLLLDSGCIHDTVVKKRKSIHQVVNQISSCIQRELWLTPCCALLEWALTRAIPTLELQCFPSSDPPSEDAPMFKHLLKFCLSIYNILHWLHLTTLLRLCLSTLFSYCLLHPLLLSFSFSSELTAWLILVDSASQSLTVCFQTGLSRCFSNLYCALPLLSFPPQPSLKPGPKWLPESWNGSLWLRAPFCLSQLCLLFPFANEG